MRKESENNTRTVPVTAYIGLHETIKTLSTKSAASKCTEIRVTQRGAGRVVFKHENLISLHP